MRRALSLVLALVPACSMFSAPPPDPAMPKEVSTLRATKDACEGYGTQLKAFFAGQSPSNDFIEGRSLYTDAKAAFNSWLEYTRQSIVDDRAITGNAEYVAQADAAQKKVTAFIQHVKKVCSKDTGSKDAATVSMPRGRGRGCGLGNGVLDFASKSDDARKTKLLTRLDTLTLKPFEDLPAN